MPGARRLIRKFLLAGAVVLALTGCADAPISTPEQTVASERPIALDAFRRATSKCTQGDAHYCQYAEYLRAKYGLAEPPSVYKPPESANTTASTEQVAPYTCHWPDGHAYPCTVPDRPTPPPTAGVSSSASTEQVGRSEITLHGEGGAFTVPVSINGAITLQFTIDSGAADVSIPADVVMTLIRTGTIDRSDFLGNRTYVMADGSTAPSPTFRIRSLRVGDREVRNVTGSIAPVKGGLLLGQSFLLKFSSWAIDNRRGVLVLD
jgi:hypothetical protein